ncbi:hypothetical protein [Methylobacterium sp. BTF04]|uniref:hypothetical protein n=1 Tax=Methylobacterium sp. BTF04 TaxID=2708300 RepID=UPI001953E601|nr:hypothetical protein [Methylobacterium sp. BTF04]
MAHFVAVMGQGVPDPDKDALDCLYFGTGSTTTVGLWEFHDIGNDRACTVSVASGPGKAKAAGKLGPRVLTLSLTGLNESSVLQGLSGSAPFTGRPSCKRGLGGR